MTLDIKKILVPLDFSASSDLALDYARALAQRFGGTLHVVHVCEIPVAVTGAMEAYTIAYADWSKILGDEAEQALGRARQAIGDVPVTTEVLFGNPARAIVEAAAGGHADMIVMGTHGRGAMMHLVMGNVAERVVRTAPCPVLTVRQRAEDAAVRDALRASVPSFVRVPS